MESTRDIEIGQWKVTNSINDIEYANDKIFDPDRNPYVVNAEAKAILLELDKKVSVSNKIVMTNFIMKMLFKISK